MALVVVTVCFGILFDRASAAQPLPAWQPAGSSLSDCRLAVEVRQALAQDAAFEGMNIGVTVREHVAVLWGGVPAPGMIARAENIARRVPGVIAVDNEVRVDSCIVPLTTNSPIALALPEGTGLAAQTFDLHWHAQSVQPVAVAASGVSRPFPTSQGERLPAGANSSPRVTLLKPIDLQTQSALNRRIQQLAASDPRLVGLGIRCLGSVVHLDGSYVSREALFEFAGRLARMPGINRVLIDNESGAGSLRIP